MTNDERNKLIDKIRKLMALSQSPNENEATAAAMKAQALLAEHNLHISEVEESGHKIEKFEINNELITESVPWRRQVIAMVAKMYFCTYFFTHIYTTRPGRMGYLRKDTHTFVGAEHNIAVARMMAEYLMGAVERLAREGSLRQPISQRSRYVTSFKHACAMRLVQRIRQRIEEAKRGGTIKTESGTTLPALRNMYEMNEEKLQNFVNAEVGKLRSVKYRPTISDRLGQEEGHRAADTIGLDKQLNGEKQGRVENKTKNLLR